MMSTGVSIFGSFVALAVAGLLYRPMTWWVSLALIIGISEALLWWLRVFWRSRNDERDALRERIEELEDALLDVDNIRERGLDS